MPEKTGTKQGKGRFVKGRSGNPAGRPAGSRHKALIALDAIGATAAPAILASVIQAAESGDMAACRILLDRAWPVRKGRLVVLDLPPIHGASDTVKAAAAIVAAVASGELTPDEGTALASTIELMRRTLETADLERRISDLEKTPGPD
ncbi:MAG: DUF5681 domain-containing protein [Acidiferrobacterales bacterium]